jgi:hypothetical protein
VRARTNCFVDKCQLGAFDSSATMSLLACPTPTLPRKRGRERTAFAAKSANHAPCPTHSYRFGWKSWLGNAAALSGALMTMKAWSVVAWQALQPVVTRP